MITTDQFTFCKNQKSLVSEASDLMGEEFGKWLTITSSHTGKVMLFDFKQVLTDEEGDIIGWEYRPVYQLPNVEKVVIYND